MSFYTPPATVDTSTLALLAGRSGGQTINGDTVSAGNLTLVSTAHATKGKINLGEAGYSYFNEAAKTLILGHDGSNYAAFAVDSAGHLAITPTGSRVAVGSGASATDGNGNLALGRLAQATTNNFAIGIGYDAQASSLGGIAMGASSRSDNDYGVAIGHTSEAHGSESIAIGKGAIAGTGARNIVIGGGIPSAANGCVGCVLMGYASSASSSAQYGTALGYGADVSANHAIALGAEATADEANSCVMGASGFPINRLYGGNGRQSAAPTGFAINGDGASGTNVAGGPLCIAGGKGTGNAIGGSVKIQASTAGASGTTLQTLATVAEFGPATIGFYGATPTTKQSLATSPTAAQIATILSNLGLVTLT